MNTDEYITLIETALSAYGTITKRIYGANRYLTSNAIAEYFFPNAEKAVIAWGDNFPDGLSGGVLANKLHAPLLLTNASKANTTKKYTVIAKTTKTSYTITGRKSGKRRYGR